MNRAANLQTNMIGNLEGKVEKVNEGFDSINARMKDALTKVRSGTRFITDVILCCVILGIAGIIYAFAS